MLKHIGKGHKTAAFALGSSIKLLLVFYHFPSTIAGDSGGPLMLHDPVLDQYEIIGVTSFGKGCDHKLYPGVYTR